MHAPRAIVIALAVSILVPSLGFWPAASASHIEGDDGTYTLNADFDEGVKVGVDHYVDDQLQLNDTATQFSFIWIAVSTKGTIVKIDTLTGDIVGEYRSAPDGTNKDPSRTTVDRLGSVWATNRAESSSVNGSSKGSVIHIGLEENGQCVDRNNNGVIDTSHAANDLKVWANAGGVDTDGGVDTAQDECIIHYVRTSSLNNRHVSVNADNDVWVSGTGRKDFELLDDETGAILRHEASVNCGAYGGLIDQSGVIWSANPFLRWDTALPLTAGNYLCDPSFDSYGLCIDSMGNVWNTGLSSGTIRKYSPAGVLLGTYGYGNQHAQGCVVDKNDHVWVAHSLVCSCNTVGHLLNDGTYVGNVVVGSQPRGSPSTRPARSGRRTTRAARRAASTRRSGRWAPTASRAWARRTSRRSTSAATPTTTAT